ncbi:MAG: stage IV sporulation protein A [Clostridia bacterium]|nr:stage IV sporulation protein A [Clostridia bacterium]
MENYSIYEDMSARTGGDIYIGVVGPVRTGKSTFIKRFMEALVLPSADEAQKSVMIDELPQSSSGKTIMTTEPKFVPAKAASIDFGNGAKASVRLVDCVGYPVAGATGFEEDGQPRLVSTPWSDAPMPFEQAAEIGTERVIKEHSTIGVLVTADGSFTAMERGAYESAEARAAAELKAIGKPFVIVLNCTDIFAAEAQRAAMEEKYGVPVLALNVEKMGESEALAVLEKVLLEFPVTRLDLSIPAWLRALPETSPMVASLLEKIRAVACGIAKMKDCKKLCSAFSEEDDFISPSEITLDAATGVAKATVEAKEELFYRVLSDQCGTPISNDCELMRYVRTLAEDQRNFEKIKQAFAEAEESGYGVAPPRIDELELFEPKLVKKGGNYGVRFKAGGASYHIMKIEVSGEVAPIVGGKAQGEQFCEEMLRSFSGEQDKIWDTNIFGKTLKELLGEELEGKKDSMPTELRAKMRRTLSKIVNDGKGGFICILL